MKSYLVGFYTVTGHGPQQVSTPLTGDAHADMGELYKLIRAKFPGCQCVRTGSTIEQRDETKRESEQGVIEFPEGATIQQLFSKENNSLVAGTCVFDGAVCNIILRFHVANNRLGVSLLERSTHTTIRFGGTTSGQRLAAEIPKAVSDILGGDARDFQWKLVQRCTID